MCGGLPWIATSLGEMLDAQLETGIQETVEEPAPAARTAEIVVGLLSYNNAATIGGIARDAQECLATYFPQGRCIVVHADGGSKDGTAEAALAAAVDRNSFVQIAYPVYPAQKISPDYYGVPGKGNGVQAIFEAASGLKASACAIVDTTTGVSGRHSLQTLVMPITEDKIDFAAACYMRHKYDATILSGIVYPLTRALYGRRIHQPVGGDYAVSGKLMTWLMRQTRPEGETTSSDSDAWITLQTLSGGFRLGEASLGPRTFSPHEPAPEVSAILTQVVGSIFTEMNRTAAFWQRIRGSQIVPVFGPAFEALPEPPPVDPTPMLQSFRLGYQNLQDIYRLVLPPATLLELKRLSLQNVDVYAFDDLLWARTIYDFALAWRGRVMDRDHLMGALTPLYLGWVASWVRAVRDSTPQEAQDRIEKLCAAYEAQKGYLISRWRWPDRFNP